MSIRENSPAYAERFWAKSEPRDGYPKRIHLLEHHLADVGTCFEMLLAQPNIRRRLARSGGLDFLDKTTAARLSVLAAMHDIGKVNVGFQTQIWRDEEMPGGRRPMPFRRVGHTMDLTPVLDQNKDSETAEWFFESLGWWWDAVESWDDRDGETVCALFVAALSHHGQPLRLENERNANPSIWRDFGGLSPREFVERTAKLVREWFPDAFLGDAPPLPASPAFQHHFLGLCTLADWIGSNETWFPFIDEPRDDYMDKARQRARETIRKVGLDLAEQRGEFPKALPEFADLFDIPGAAQANAIQIAAIETPMDESLVIIESETGSGKTEAALWRFARMYEAGLVDGLYFALPTRAAASQLHGRVTRFVERTFPAAHRPEPALAVPGYLKSGDVTGRRMQGYEVWWDGDQHDGRRWAAEGAKRYLAAQIAVGTVDQAMMAALKVRHAHMRAACLSRNLLVVDEVHASDPYMRRILRALLEAHIEAGGFALLMSATLGSAARHEWLSSAQPCAVDAPSFAEAINSPYPALSVAGRNGGSMNSTGENNRQKTVKIVAEPLMHDFPAVSKRAELD